MHIFKQFFVSSSFLYLESNRFNLTSIYCIYTSGVLKNIDSEALLTQTEIDIVSLPFNTLILSSFLLVEVSLLI